MLPIRDVNPRTGPAPVTWTLLGLNVIVFLAQVGLFGSDFAFDLMRRTAFVPAAFFANPSGSPFAPITTTFLHADPVHLASNLFFLAVFGDNVEERLGPSRFLVLYLAGAASSSLLHGAIAPTSPLPMVGASGAISAVLAAYVLWFPRRPVQAFVVPLFLPWLLGRLLLPLPRFHLWWLPAWLYIGYWALIQLVEAGGTLVVGMPTGGGVAWWAHLGGFVFGLLVAPQLRRTTQAGSIRP